jgi:hypothetical protein
MELDMRIGAIDADVSFDRLHIRALLDLWAWFVAHPSFEAMREGADELKQRLRAALPLFDKFALSGAFRTIAVDSSLGRFTADRAGIGFDLNGLASRGAFTEKIAFSGLRLPGGLAPAFAGVAPTDMAFEVTFSGYDAASAVDLVLGNLDLGAAPPLKPEIAARVFETFLPEGVLTVALKHGRIASDLAELTFEGQVKVANGRRPTGSGLITAKGLDAVASALVVAAQSDPRARKAVMGLALARGFGKPGPDGVTVWRIETAPDGRPLVNGVPLGPEPGQKP